MFPYYYDAYKPITKKDVEDGLEIRWAGHYECSPDFSIIRTHPRYMLLYILDGICKYKTAAGDIIDLTKGDIVFYRPYEPQWIRADQKQPMTLCGVCFSGSIIDTIVKTCSLYAVQYERIGINSKLIVFFDKIINEIIMNKEGISILGLLLGIFGEIETCLRNLSKNNENDVAGQSFIERTANYILLNYNKQLNINQIAAVMGYSVSRFQYLFKKQYNQSAKEFLINERIDKAKELLVESVIRINEIGFAVGFKDPYYFSKMFKKKVGMSPREYRNQGKA